MLKKRPRKALGSDQRPSRSALKRQSLARQDLGLELTRLTASDWRRLPLTPELLEALELYVRINDHEGRRRQMQYIGRLIREEYAPDDIASLRSELAALHDVSAAELARFHQTEAWRTQFIDAEDLDASLDDFMATLKSGNAPERTRTNLRQLAEKVRESRQNGHSGNTQSRKAYRELFRVIASLLDSSGQ